MTKSHYYSLLCGIYIAPHVSPWLGVSMAVAFSILAVLFYFAPLEKA